LLEINPDSEHGNGQCAGHRQTHAGKWTPSQSHGPEKHNSSPGDGNQLKSVKEDVPFQSLASDASPRWDREFLHFGGGLSSSIFHLQDGIRNITNVTRVHTIV
jgi:hypothetical protein